MQQRHITPQHVAPYIIGGATGVHVLTRMRRLSRQPAMDIPLHRFLLKNTDVVLALSGASVVIWQLAQHKPRQETATTTPTPNGFTMGTTEASVIASVVHELRQVFTALLVGLGVTERRAKKGQAGSIPALVQRMKDSVRRGIHAVDRLDTAEASDGYEREYRA